MVLGIALKHELFYFYSYIMSYKYFAYSCVDSNYK